MPDMTTKSFPQILADQATAAQASAGRSVDFSTGGLLRALSEAIGSVALWLQAEVLKVLSATRLATITGADADSFVGDFGLARNAAAAATGEVTMSRFTTGLDAVIPVGATLRTSDGQVTFAVSGDATYAGWDASLPGYRLAAGSASTVVPIVAPTSGGAGNVDAGTVSLLTTPISGIDTVVNLSPGSSGADAESTDALRVRFPTYISLTVSGHACRGELCHIARTVVTAGARSSSALGVAAAVIVFTKLADACGPLEYAGGLYILKTLSVDGL